jgi:hypothetical protein
LKIITLQRAKLAAKTVSSEIKPPPLVVASSSSGAVGTTKT